MSLKAFHVFFITVSTILALCFGGWSIMEYRRVDGAGNLVLAVLSFVFAAALIVYGKWFLEKLKGVE